MKKVIAIMLFILLLLCACNQQDNVDSVISTQTMNTAEISIQPEKAVVDNKSKKSEINNEVNIEVAPTITTQTKNNMPNSIQSTVDTCNPMVDKNNTTKEKRMKEEVESIYIGMIATIDIGNDEISGQRVVHCLLKYPSNIDTTTYLSQLKVAENIISRYETDEYTQIVISIECPSYEGAIITLGYYGTIVLSENIDKLDKIMNNNKKYLSLGEATTGLEKWLNTVCPSTEDVFWNVRIEGEDVFYMFYVAYINRTIYVNASDGSITTLFDGEEYVSVQYATENQIEAVLSFLKSSNGNINNMQNIKALLIDNKYVDLLCDEAVTPYLLKEKDGKVTVEPYEEFLGD